MAQLFFVKSLVSRPVFRRFVSTLERLESCLWRLAIGKRVFAFILSSAQVLFYPRRTFEDRDSHSKLLPVSRTQDASYPPAEVPFACFGPPKFACGRFNY